MPFILLFSYIILIILLSSIHLKYPKGNVPKCPKQKRPQKDIILLLLQIENYINQHKIRFLQVVHHVYLVLQCLHDS